MNMHSDAAIPNGKITTVAELGAAVRAARRASGLRQVDAAAMLGVGPRFLSELERGKQSCSLGKALQVLVRLGLEVWVWPRGRAYAP